jgi:hypothetical protein
METALQEAIEKAKTAKENDKNKDYVTYDEVIEMLTDLLPKEQEAIEQAYDIGAIEMYDIDATARNYFNQTYKEHGK